MHGDCRNACVHQIFTGPTPRNCGNRAEKASAAARPADGDGDGDGGCDRFPAVKRTAVALFAFLALMGVAAPAALAENGVGLAGPTTDKTVTFFCMGVLIFFVALVVIMSLIQGKLERRKDQRRSDLQRLS